MKTYQRLVLHNAKKAPKTKKTKINGIDVMAYIGGIAGNLAVLPQIIKAWQGPAPGLAISTWILFICVDLTWLVYAVRRKQMPLLVTEVVGLFFYAAVITGWFFHTRLS